MKLHELKKPAGAGAFATNLKKLSANMSLGDVKDALRRSKGLDEKLVKQLSFASSFRRHDDKVSGGALTTTLEVPNVGMLNVKFELDHGVIVVTSLSKQKPKEEDPNAAK
jgi:hypothetical protein